MSLPRRQLLLWSSPHNPQSPGPIVTSAEEDDILAFTRLSVPHLLSGGSEEPKDFRPSFLSSGIDDYVNQCFGLLYFVDLDTGASVVWNPSTGAQRYIHPPTGDDVLRTLKVGYTYNATSCFGYDPQSGAFKVLKCVEHVHQTMGKDGIAYDNGPEVEQYLLYSTQTNRWVDFPCPKLGHRLQDDSVYLNGCCFWVNGGEDTVVSFSFSDENFLSFPLNIPTLNRRRHSYRVINYEADEENNALGDRDESDSVHKSDSSNESDLYESDSSSESDMDESDSSSESDMDEGDRDDCYIVLMVEVDEENTLGFVVYSKSHFQFWTCVINSGRMPEEDDHGCVWLKRWEFCVDFPEECIKGRPLSVYENGDELLMFMVNLNGQLMVYSSAAEELKLLPLFTYDLISYHETSIDPNN